MSEGGFGEAFLANLGDENSENFSFVTMVEGSATMGAKKIDAPACCGRGDTYAMFSVTLTSSLDTKIEEITLLRYFLVSKTLVVSSILMMSLQS